MNIELLRTLCGFVRCPTTGRTIQYIQGDDKAICGCDAAIERGGTHVVALCEVATAEDWLVDR